MPAFSVARRLWITPDCPPDLTTYKPEGYPAATCALVYGGTMGGMPPEAWLDGLKVQIGMTDAANSTLCLRHVTGFLWVAYWDPTGQAAPAQPRIPVWPPE